MKHWSTLCVALIAMAFSTIMRSRPDWIIRPLAGLPKPFAYAFLLGFRIRNIKPDSEEAFRFYRITGTLGLIFSALLLLQFLLQTLGV